MKTRRFQVRPNSRISRWPKFFRPALVIIREVYLILGFKFPKYKFESDGMATNHITDFTQTSVFQSSYNRACEFAGEDFQIPWRVHQAMFGAKYALSLGNGMIFVELGTGRGFVMSAIQEFLLESTDVTEYPETYCFDTFSPYSVDSDGNQNSSNGTNDRYASDYSSVVKNFSRWKNVTLIKGELPQSLNQLQNKTISFLHIDLNSPFVEIECLKILWSKLSPGCFILLDDYANDAFRRSYTLFETFFESKNLSILTTPSGQGIVILGK